MVHYTFKKAAFVFVLIAALFTGSILQDGGRASAQTVKTAFVHTKSKTSLNVRSGAGTGYKSLGRLAYGSSVKVYGSKKKGWSEIRYKEKKAYVSTEYLKFYTGVKISKNNYKDNKDLTYAQVTGMKDKKAQAKINQALLKEAKADYAYYLKIHEQAEKDKKSGSCQAITCDYEFQTNYSIKYNDGSKLSILYSNYEYIGGAHGMNYAQSFNFLIKDGSQVPINKVLTTKTKMTNVQKYLYQKIRDKEPFRMFVTKQQDVPVTKNLQFYYMYYGIKTVFQQYDIAPYAAGNPIISVPSSVYK